MKNYIIYAMCILLAVFNATATHAQQPTRDMSRFTGKGQLAPASGNTMAKSFNATHVKQHTRDLNQFAGKAPLAPGSGAFKPQTNNIIARKAVATSVNLPSASATEKKQEAKNTGVPVGPPAAVTVQENAKTAPAAAPKAKTLAKPAPAKP